MNALAVVSSRASHCVIYRRRHNPATIFFFFWLIRDGEASSDCRLLAVECGHRHCCYFGIVAAGVFHLEKMDDDDDIKEEGKVGRESSLYSQVKTIIFHPSISTRAAEVAAAGIVQKKTKKKRKKNDRSSVLECLWSCFINSTIEPLHTH